MACSIVQVRRGDSDLLPRPDLILEVGDRVGVLVHRSKIKQVRAFFGDSIKGLPISAISRSVSALRSVCLSNDPLPVPGLGKLTLGLAGLLLFALYLGKVRRTGSLVWTMPLSANLVLRNFGLTIFLAQVGITSGPKFFATVGTTGITFLVYGAFIALALVLITAFMCLLGVPPPLRYGTGRDLRRYRQPGHSCLCQPHRANRSAGCRLCDDLSLHDHSQDSVCSDRRHIGWWISQLVDLCTGRHAKFRTDELTKNTRKCVHATIGQRSCGQ